MARPHRGGDDPWTPSEQLDLFVKRVLELNATRLVNSGGLATELSITFSDVQPLKIQTQQLDEDDLKSFLLTFRQFTSDSEPIYVNRIYRILESEINSDVIQNRLRAGRRQWHQQNRNGSLKVVINDRTFPPVDLLDFWINGYYFHNDKRKASALFQRDPLGHVLTQQVFLDCLIETTRYLFFLWNVVMIARREGLLETA
jgi:hypothetical protein